MSGKAEFDVYRCEVRRRGKKGMSIKPRTFNGAETKTFHRPATKAKLNKLYVIMDGREFCYVGLARTSITMRMRTGCKPHLETGYHGYDLKGLREFDLYVHVFPSHRDKRFPEAVEAELAYLIRAKTGRWPTRQHEIHFHNDVLGARAHAKLLYHKLSGRSTND